MKDLIQKNTQEKTYRKLIDSPEDQSTSSHRENKELYLSRKSERKLQRNLHRISERKNTQIQFTDRLLVQKQLSDCDRKRIGQSTVMDERFNLHI